MHIKAVMGPEYIVVQIALLTLRKLIYRDCVSYSKMLVYILICLMVILVSLLVLLCNVYIVDAAFILFAYFIVY